MLALIQYQLWMQQLSGIQFSAHSNLQLRLCIMKAMTTFAVSYRHLAFCYKYIYFLYLHRPILLDLWKLLL